MSNGSCCLIDIIGDNYKVLEGKLKKHERTVYSFSIEELEALIEYDTLSILAIFYRYSDLIRQEQICSAVNKQYHFLDVAKIMNSSPFAKEITYIPLAIRLAEQTADRDLTRLIFTALMDSTKDAVLSLWDSADYFSNDLAMLNAAYFQRLSVYANQRSEYQLFLCTEYRELSYPALADKYIDSCAFSKGLNKKLQASVVTNLVECKENIQSVPISLEECNVAINQIEEIRLNAASQKQTEMTGIESILGATGISLSHHAEIDGMNCYFCIARNKVDEYIIVYQHASRLGEIVDDEMRWQKFQHDLYYSDIRSGQNSSQVYIVYILDEDSSGIPIQAIESNRTYGRKYVFTEEETVTFINGIIRKADSNDTVASPVQEWDRILSEVHLTGCMTELFLSKHITSYLDGHRFDSNYRTQEEDYIGSTSTIPRVKWVKSLDTTGFREFCFDSADMEFGQINLLYGANGSGKTSVLEALEYAMTAEVRRVKDFKVKLPSSGAPAIKIYDTEAGIHTFTPAFSKKNAKEIERVWYGVPAGRTKSNLNENFNRFNSFDSEAAYKFIHSSDNDADSFAVMFGNLMFGETVVGYEKKWTRYKKAFDEQYSELRAALSEARSTREYCMQTLADKKIAMHGDEIEALLQQLSFISRASLPKAEIERYIKVLDELKLVRKYVDVLQRSQFSEKTTTQIRKLIADEKENRVSRQQEIVKKREKLVSLAASTTEQRRIIISERKEIEAVRGELNEVFTSMTNWSTSERILRDTKTISVVERLSDEESEISRKLWSIEGIEKYPAIVRFLNLGEYSRISESERKRKNDALAQLKQQELDYERRYQEAKSSFGVKEQQAIELRRIGKTLLINATCPLCGHQYGSTQELLAIIETSTIVDDSMESLILEIGKLSEHIQNLEKVLEREALIDVALLDLERLYADDYSLSKYERDYAALYKLLLSKPELEKRKAAISEQLRVYAEQGVSLLTIYNSREFKHTDPMYAEYAKHKKGTFDEFLDKRYHSVYQKVEQHEKVIAECEQKIRENDDSEVIIRGEIHELEISNEAANVDPIIELENALDNIATKFSVKKSIVLGVWGKQFITLFDLTEREVQRIQSEDSIRNDLQLLEQCNQTIERETPRVERCARAVQALERMPSLSTFVENGIRKNIQQISNFFKRMHHSGEFVELGIDSDGVFAIRGINKEKIRTYQMSTGQRATIAMAVMFALHLAAPDAPQLLLLDEPLATMDDTQVLNVLDILKSLAENNTQIFFTTANGVMINLFKECFYGTHFDYKEFHFTKKTNSPSSIAVSSVNSVKTIAELTLDDLTLDFHQFAQIREVLRKNQEKLVDQSEWEEISTTEPAQRLAPAQVDTPLDDDNFYGLLNLTERRILDILVCDQPNTRASFQSLVAPFPSYSTVLERINEKAVDFFNETIIVNDEEIPFIEEEYLEELIQLHESFYSDHILDTSVASSLGIDGRMSFDMRLHKDESQRQDKEKERILLSEQLRQSESRSAAAEEQRKQLELQLQRSMQQLSDEEIRRRQLEVEHKQSVEQLSTSERQRTQLEKRLQAYEQIRADYESQQSELTEQLQQLGERSEAEMSRRMVLEAELQRSIQQLSAEEIRRAQLEEAVQASKERYDNAEEQQLLQKMQLRLTIVLRDRCINLREAELLSLSSKLHSYEQLIVDLQTRYQESEAERGTLSSSISETERQLTISENQRSKMTTALTSLQSSWDEEHNQRLLLEQKVQSLVEQRIAEERDREALAANRQMYRRSNLCQYCGGPFTGVFNKKCRSCGKIKDY